MSLAGAMIDASVRNNDAFMDQVSWKLLENSPDL